MPAEWEPHEGTWLAWPHEASDWPGKFEAIQWVYCEIVKRLARVERVHILVKDEEPARRALDQAQVAMESIDFFECPTNRSWTRDYCPIFVKDSQGQTVITNWHFNGWAKYANWQSDDAVPSAIARRYQMPEIEPGLVLEGGSIDVNGRGLLLSTEECLLSDVQARNPGTSREELEQIFAKYLGISQTIWLKNGIAGDDTHGHVDDLARFVSVDTVVLAVEQDRSDANFEPLQENLRILRRNQAIRVVPLPMPAPIFFDGQRLPASYANFYIANRLVLVPTFNDVNDRVALGILAECFPEREVVGIHCGDLVLGLGTLHCMTQQQIA